MTTPNTSISQLGLSDVNVELNFAANTARNFNDGIFRNLTGSQPRQIANSAINISDLSGKTAFGGIISANSSNVTSYGVIEREINLLANTDMYSPDVVWSANLVTGVPGTLTQNGRQASYKITGVQEANVSANVLITATLSYQGHTIGTAQKYISFEINSLPPLLFVNGNTQANSVAFEPTAVATSLTASANAPGSTVVFTVVPNDAGVLVSGNTVTLSASAQQAGQDNNRSYSILTQLFFGGQVIASDLKNVNVRAFYSVPDFIYSTPATVNNSFANTGTIHSSLTLTTDHAIPNANIVWSVSKVSGDDAILTVAPDKKTANLHVNVASGVFTTKKSVYDVIATLEYANGQYITSKTQRLTLRTGAYGLTLNPASANASGYTSQTASASVTATYLAGTFSWNIAQLSGNVASVSNNVVAGSATATLNLTQSGVGSASSVYRVSPVLMFDGVVMANVASNTSLSAEQLAYTFGLSGPTSNTILGAAPVSTTLETTAAHNIANGTVTFSKPAGVTTLSANGLVATTTYVNSTIGQETFSLSAALFDQFGRQVEVINRSLTHRAYDPAISFAGANSITRIGYTNQTAVASVNASARAGANTLVVTAAKINGSDLVFNTNGNSSITTSTLTASQTTVGTREGLYRLTANVTWFGVSNSRTYDVLVSATKDDAAFVMGGSGESKASYNFPVIANGTFTASHAIPGGTVTWARTINSGTVSDTPVNNPTNYTFRTIQNSVGVSTANVTVTATLFDANGGLVESKSNTVSTSATVNNPTLALNGPDSNTVTNSFSASASITLTPSVAAGLTGHTYTFSFAAVNGSATVTSNSSAARLVASYDGAGQQTGTYDVTCNVIFGGQTIASTTRRVTVSAVCPAPTLNISGVNSVVGSFNFPVNSWGYADASSSPAGAVISWSWTYAGGVGPTNIYTELAGSRLVLHNSQSNYGALDSHYDFTATFRTPAGTLLGTRTVRVRAYSERYNPNLSWNYVNGVYSNSVTGFADTLQSTVSLQASVNPALGGHVFRISPFFSGGNWNNASIATNNNAGTATVTAVNTISAGHGTSQKSSTYDFYIDVMLNGQVISGQLMQRTYHTITPGAISAPNVDDAQHVWNGTAVAGITVSNNGNVYTASNGQLVGAWMTPNDSSQTANFDVNFGSGWLQLNVPRQAVITATGTTTNPSNNSGGGSYSIRNRNTGQVLATGSWAGYAEVGQPV